MNLIPLPAFTDNYVWLLHDGQRALVVDPGDAQPVLAFLAQHRLQLNSILLTHHHPDHTGGVDTLRNDTGAAVYRPASERLPEPLTRLVEGDTVQALGLAYSRVHGRARAHGRPHRLRTAPSMGRRTPAVLWRHAVFGWLWAAF